MSKLILFPLQFEFCYQLLQVNRQFREPLAFLVGFFCCIHAFSRNFTNGVYVLIYFNSHTRLRAGFIVDECVNLSYTLNSLGDLLQ